MKKTILINTYAQLIIALQLKNTLFKNDNVIALISDHSPNAYIVAQRLNDLKIFNRVIFVNSKFIDYSETKYNMIRYIIDPLIYKKNVGWIKGELEPCDEFIYYNFGRSTNMIHLKLFELNPSMICHRMEEGILSYNNFCHDAKYSELRKSDKINYIFHQMMKKDNCQDEVKNFYCFYPSFYKGVYKAVEIPRIKLGSPIVGILKEIFDIKNSMIEYKEKYIFFASVGDFEGEEKIGEVETVLRIANKIGKDNIIVKVHPRDTTNSFANAGLKIDKNSSIPWEVIQLNYNFSKHIFLTATSGSVLFVNMLLDSNLRPKTYFLYNIMNVDHNSIAKISADAARELFSSPYITDDMLRNIYEVNRLDEIL